MKIYIAAPWKHRGQVPGIAAKIEAAGHTITWRWWTIENVPESERTVENLRHQAINDVQGVKDADLVLLINSERSEGKSLEQGIAVADNKPIIAVGTRGEFSQNVFHYLTNYRWVTSVDEALEILSTVQWLTSHEGV